MKTQKNASEIASEIDIIICIKSSIIHVMMTDYINPINW